MSDVGRGIVARQLDRLFGAGTLTGMGEGPLLERYLSDRDEDAFAALVDRLGPMVLGLCRRMLRDPRDVEDAFQATFLVLVRKAPAIRDRDRLSSWLYGVAYRVARRARSRTLRRRGREASVVGLEVAAGPVATDGGEIASILDRELSGLPERYRAPLVLCYLRGRTHEQAAADLSCPVGTVRSRMARGREILRRRLERRGFAPTAVVVLLAPDPTRFLAAVPSTMAAATVRAAVGFASSSIFQAGAAAATSVVLARGVLTTMKLAQLKWIGLAAIVTGLSAGGVVAVGSAPGPGPQAAANLDGAAKAKDETQKKAVSIDTHGDGRPDPVVAGEPAPPTSATDARLKALEQKIDQLMGRLGTPGAENSIDALEPQLNNRLKQYRRIDDLVRQKAVEQRLADEARDQVLIAVGRVEALADQIRDELERLELERRRKAAMLDKARAEEEVAAALIARDRILNGRKQGMIAAEEVAKHIGEYKVAVASSKIAEVDLEDVTARIKQVGRKRVRIREALRLVERAKEEIRRPAEATPPAPAPR